MKEKRNMKKTYIINGKITNASGFGWIQNIMINGAEYIVTLVLSSIDDSILSSFKGQIDYTVTLNKVTSKSFDVTDKVLEMIKGVSSYSGRTVLDSSSINFNFNENGFVGSFNISINVDWTIITGNVNANGDGKEIESNAIGTLF